MSAKDKEYSKAWQVEQDQKRFAVKLEKQMLDEINRFVIERNKKR